MFFGAICGWLVPGASFQPPDLVFGSLVSSLLRFRPFPLRVGFWLPALRIFGLVFLPWSFTRFLYSKLLVLKSNLFKAEIEYGFVESSFVAVFLCLDGSGKLLTTISGFPEVSFHTLCCAFMPKSLS